VNYYPVPDHPGQAGFIEQAVRDKFDLGKHTRRDWSTSGQGEGKFDASNASQNLSYIEHRTPCEAGKAAEAQAKEAKTAAPSTTSLSSPVWIRKQEAHKYHPKSESDDNSANSQDDDSDAGEGEEGCK
jgi:hypothetical protein